MPQPSPAELRQELQQQAQRLGFELFGVTTPDPPPHYAIFSRWIAAGRHGEMGYLANERSLLRRAEPRQILPECRSILVLGVRYPAPLPRNPPEREEGKASIRGRTASYAWGDDYHAVLPERLSALVTWIEQRVGAPIPHRWYTDTGPLLERDLAQRAGLGWIGKNTCLINPQAGSYFLLAEVLLGLELAPDEPFQFDRCGACTRCLEACPTSCILPDRTIDARRCISYLTIELKDEIPLELRPRLADWVFGCDVCQEVCPWNRRFARQEGDPAFAPRPDAPQPDLLQALQLTPEAFQRKFKQSPLKRAKRRGYLRNVAVSLGCAQDPEATPGLVSVLADAERLVRLHTAWALGEIGGNAARRGLEQAAGGESDPGVLEEIQAALDRIS